MKITDLIFKIQKFCESLNDLNHQLNDLNLLTFAKNSQKVIRDSNHDSDSSKHYTKPKSI